MAERDLTPTLPTRTGRRALAGGAVLALLGATAARAAIPEANPDAELIRLCAAAETAHDHLMEAEMQWRRMHRDDPGREAARHNSDDLFDDFGDAVDRVIAIPATTAEGLRAKAAVALCDLHDVVENQSEVVLNVLRELAGRA